MHIDLLMARQRQEQEKRRRCDPVWQLDSANTIPLWRVRKNWSNSTDAPMHHMQSVGTGPEQQKSMNLYS
jgi:hypothetical protein